MENPFAYNRCKILSKHFIVGLWRNVNYIVNIIEKLSRSGRDDNGIPIPGATGQRQKMETKWLITLQTVYPYGLNDKVGDEYKAGNLYKRPKYNYSKIKLDNSFLKQTFFKVITTNLDHDIFFWSILPWGYVDVGDRWNKNLLERLHFIISFWYMFPFSS